MTTQVTLIRITLQLDDAWRIGGFRDHEEQTQQPTLRNPLEPGEAYLPASSLMGGLRAHLEATLTQAVQPWLGLPPDAMPRNRDRAPYDDGEKLVSKLWALGVVLSDVTIATHGSTAIDPRSGAACPNTLRSVETASSGNATWYLQADGWLPDELLTHGLRTWNPIIGGGRSIGHGSARVLGIEALTLDLTSREHLAWWLTGRSQWLDGGPTPTKFYGKRVWKHDPPEDKAAPRGRYRWEHIRKWKTIDPLAVGSGTHVVTDATRPAGRQGQTRALRTRGTAPILPGSSVKGVYRARCRFILDAIGVSSNHRDRTLARLFGAAPTDPDNGSGRRGILRFHDSLIDLPKNPAGKREPVVYTHVAIDRISGGSDDGKLFSVQAAPPGSTFHIRITSETKLTEAEQALLRAVDLDVDDGLAAFGGLTSRGYGTVGLVTSRPERVTLQAQMFEEQV